MVGVAGDCGKSCLGGRVFELVCPGFNSQGGAGVACMVAKGSNTTTSVICEKFEVEKGAAALGEPRENLLPTTLALVTVCELNMGMFERN